MEWKIFLTAMSTIFWAELGDKTQLASLGLAAKSSCSLAVFLGAVVAFSAVTLISVALGGILGKFLRPEVIRYLSGTIFASIGILMLLGKL
ncbi:MAG: TMEM165/GDT1 family protein [Candidatus Omnitrophica bacterium]|nr:TMEM165/GDT1 family protein [Candidatus Omnitrophota bacterium]